MPSHSLGVLAAGLWCLLALGVQFRDAKAYGKRKLFAAPAGDPGAGVRYVFLQGMAPQAKESVLLHLPSYAAGMAYHAGVFTAFALLAVQVTGLRLPGWGSAVGGFLALAGACGGLALLLKRLLTPHLRGLSSADDYVSNLLATAFAGLAFCAAWVPRCANTWMLAGILLLLYAPLGKIRHCLFFFPTRFHLGAFFGRRGVFPPGGQHNA